MDRRLYFLFPSEHQLCRALDELTAGIDDMHLNILSHNDFARENLPTLQ